MNQTAGARLRRLTRGALLTLLVAVFHAPIELHAQVPVPRRERPDTVRADTIRADTIPADTALVDTMTVVPQDSARPAVVFPLMPRRMIVQPALTDRVWDREALLREAPVTLLDLLERIPGVVTLRSGTYVQPEAASAFGMTAGRTEVIVDGFILDPLAGRTLDLSQIALGQLREVRVQRRLGLLRIILTTEYPEGIEPYTRIEAGIGVPDANMFRGIFLAPHVIAGPLGIGIERVDSDGVGRRQPASVFTGWAKWSFTNETRGIQFEIAQRSLDREAESPWPIERTRRDMVLRARNRFGPDVVGELYAGQSTVDESALALVPTDPRTSFYRESIQAGVRLGVARSWGEFETAFRYRSLDLLPVFDGRIEAVTAVGPLTVGGEVGALTWDGHPATSYLSVRGEIGRLYGLSAFGELTAGERGAPFYTDTIGSGIAFTDRSGYRGGLSLDFGRAAGSVAMIRLDQDSIVPFGLAFDDAAPAFPVGTADGFEAHGRVVLWPDHLVLSSWITDWRDAPGWIWMPSRSWRTALELHWLPLSSGNLEIFARGEAHMRGSLLVPNPLVTPETAAVVALPAFTTVDAYLQIRIIAVRMFLRWEDMTGVDIEEVPGRIYRGPRIFYGVKWDLHN